MAKQRVFLTGATGTMGFLGVQALLADADELELIVLVQATDKRKTLLTPYAAAGRLQTVDGDLVDYASVERCVRGADIVLHVGALVSPAADYQPALAMQVNYGSTVNIIRAIKALGQAKTTQLVYIGTVAETGDRMIPIHWGRVGDPIKPSVYDYYAVSKIAAERDVIESGLPYWVSLRQTGIMGPAMAHIEDAIIFHNGLDNVLEYVSDRDSATLLRNVCAKARHHALDERFWGHIFNVGGGEQCRASMYDMFVAMLNAIGIHNPSYAVDSRWFATRNFHGQYYLDSDKLEQIVHFRHDSMQYFYDAYIRRLGTIATVARFITKLPGGQRTISGLLKRRFRKLASTEHGTIRFIQDNMEEHIAAYWGSSEAWSAILPFEEFTPFDDWQTVMSIDHGYDETQPEDKLCLADLKKAAVFRGGTCLADTMRMGDWRSKLRFVCAFDHSFEASPRLVLEGGHWCPVCERESWNYAERAKRDPFFAQVWNPLHAKGEKAYIYPKVVSELDVALATPLSGPFAKVINMS